MSDPVLSICIATRNRADFIGTALESISTQATNEVEIVVVDGASTDNTSEVVQGYQRRFPRLRYYRLEVNGGIDRDYSRAVELAQGKYCWFMTDDDVLKPGAIASVLPCLQREYSLIIVNAENRTVDQERVIVSRRFPIDVDRVYSPTDMEALFVDAGYYLTYIGGVIIQRALWNARDKASYCGTWFVHFGVIFQAPLPGDTLVLAEPLIGGRIGNISWSAKSFEIWMFRWPTLVWSMPHFSETAKRGITPKEPWRNLKALLIGRGDGSYTLTEYQRWIAPLPANALQRFAYQLIARLPACAVWLGVFVYFSVFRRQRRTEIYHWLHVPVAQHCFRRLCVRADKCILN